VGIGTSSPSVPLEVNGTYGQIRSTNGTVTSQWYQDTGTGSAVFGTVTNNAQVFRTNAAERMRISSTGNVGIGTSSPQARVQINTPTDNDGLFIVNTSVASSTSKKVRLLFRGTDTANTPKDAASITSIPNEANYINASMAFSTRGGDTITERMRIAANGDLFVGKTANSASIAGNVLGLTGSGFNESVSGDASGLFAIWYLNRQSSDGTAIEFRRAAGTVGSISVTPSGTSYNTISDERLKDNIVDAPSSSDDIDAIQVRSFDWKADGSHQKYGMIAQELMTVAPEAVSGDPESDEMMGVDYSKLVPMLVKEIQLLRARVAQLETN
jgi:hypothetical protein